MDATAIFDRLISQYSHCQTYSDSGFADFSDINNKAEHILFRTQFVRPDYFCFEWQDYGPGRGKSNGFSTLWSYGKRHIVRWDLKGKIRIQERPSLLLAVAGATGCSAGTAQVVAALLTDEVGDNSKGLSKLSDIKLSGREVFENRECFVLKGTGAHIDDHVLRVSTENYALVSVYKDLSTTAEESRKQDEGIRANEQLMARLIEKGIAPPQNVEHKDRHFVTQYTYRHVALNEPVELLPEPTL